jgi:hypothetical protein
LKRRAFNDTSSKTYKGGISHMNLSNKNIKHYCIEGRILFPYFYQTEVSLNARLFKLEMKIMEHAMCVDCVIWMVHDIVYFVPWITSALIASHPVGAIFTTYKYVIGMCLNDCICLASVQYSFWILHAVFFPFPWSFWDKNISNIVLTHRRMPGSAGKEIYQRSKKWQYYLEYVTDWLEYFQSLPCKSATDPK